eukprot:1190696-Pyramimonas_sp.AAC.1
MPQWPFGQRLRFGGQEDHQSRNSLRDPTRDLHELAKQRNHEQRLACEQGQAPRVPAVGCAGAVLEALGEASDGVFFGS